MIDELKRWLLERNESLSDIDPHTDLVDERIIDSLTFVEFVYVLQKISGRTIDVQNLDISTFRTLESIESTFLQSAS